MVPMCKDDPLKDAVAIRVRNDNLESAIDMRHREECVRALIDEFRRCREYSGIVEIGGTQTVAAPVQAVGHKTTGLSFGEAMKGVVEGKRLTRTDKRHEGWVCIDHQGYLVAGPNYGHCDLSKEDILATDWEIVKE